MFWRHDQIAVLTCQHILANANRGKTINCRDIAPFDLANGLQPVIACHDHVSDLKVFNRDKAKWGCNACLRRKADDVLNLGEVEDRTIVKRHRTRKAARTVIDKRVFHRLRQNTKVAELQRIATADGFVA